jgi:hypothetical protein
MLTKYTKLPQNKSKWPHGTPNGHKIYQNFPFKGLPKCTRMGVWLENKPSGNPGADTGMGSRRGSVVDEKINRNQKGPGFVSQPGPDKTICVGRMDSFGK